MAGLGMAGLMNECANFQGSWQREHWTRHLRLAHQPLDCGCHALEQPVNGCLAGVQAVVQLGCIVRVDVLQCAGQAGMPGSSCRGFLPASTQITSWAWAAAAAGATATVHRPHSWAAANCSKTQQMDPPGRMPGS